MGLFDWLKKTDGGGPAAAHDEEGRARLDAARPRGELGERFVDEGQVAKGGMGSVRRVFNRNLLRKEAMKVLDPGMAQDENEVLRFLEEAQITGQLEHPNIPAVHEVGELEGLHFFTMKLVKGQTLEQYLLNPRFTIADEVRLFDVLQVLIKACDAIAFAHSRGVIHCDLKPPNVMIGRHGQVYVMDWGIARIKGATRKRKMDTGADLVRTAGRDPDADKGRVMGTLGYMPPEQAHGHLDQLDERSDVFALGALLYRILTGRAPHLAPTPEETWELAKSCEVPEPVSVVTDAARRAAIPPRLAQIAMKALQGDKDLRYQTVHQLKADLEDFIRGTGRFPTQTFEAGQLVIREGAPGDAAYVITAGKARAFRSENGAKRTLRQMGPGDVFGETAILTEQPRTASVEAVEPLTVVVVSRDALQKEVGQTHLIGQILKALAERFRDVDLRLQREEHSPEGQVREAVLRYVAFNGQPGEQGARTVPWTPLRRHLKQTLKLGDLQVMALVTSVKGLRIDDRADLAVLMPDGARPPSQTAAPQVPAARPASRPSMPAVPAEPDAPAEEFGSTEMISPEALEAMLKKSGD